MSDSKPTEPMKPEEFKRILTPSGKIQYEHIENGNKRVGIMKALREGRITLQEFEAEQKKMRGGKYLKCLYSESQYLKAMGG